MRTGMILLLSITMLIAKEPQMWTLSSPDKDIRVSVRLQQGRLYYAVAKHNRELISRSRLGLALAQHPGLTEMLQFERQNRSSHDSTWITVWGENRAIQNQYNELKLGFTRGTGQRFDVVFRAFDDGAAFRYQIDRQSGFDSLNIMDELTEFNIDPESEVWWIPAFAGNRYEYLYRNTRVNTMDTVHTPVTFRTPDHYYLCVHEAALTDFASMTLRRTEHNTLKAFLVPWSDGVKVKTKTPMQSPWRTIQIADRPGALVESSMILNLNEPNQLQDVSWI